MLYFLIATAIVIATVYYIVKLLNDCDIKPINLFNIFVHFRRKDIQRFVDEHNELFLEAQKTNDYGKVTSHFYDVMAELIEVAYGNSFHFSPRYHPGQTNNDALKVLHQKMVQYLNLHPGKHCLELGMNISCLILITYLKFFLQDVVL